jgi:AI-2 transport protein TqsA
LILAVIAIGFALYFMRPVLLPLLFAIFLYLCLTPLIDFQIRQMRFHHALALTTTALLGTLTLLLLIMIAASSVSRMMADMSIYQAQLDLLVERLSRLIPANTLGGSDARNYLNISQGTIGGVISGVVYGLSGLVSNGVFVVILTVFILISRGQRYHQGLIADLELHVRRYISSTMLLSLLTGGLVGLTLALLGVRYAVVFGLFAFLLNFIPLIGPVVATLLPLPIALLSPEISPVGKVLAVAGPGVIQFVMGQIVSPRVIGRSLALHPVTILLFLLFFQMIWGIGGAFMSTPIAAVLKILFDHFETTQPFGRLMSGELDLFQTVSSDT